MKNPKQFGFRTNRSIENALISLIKTMKHDLDNGLYVCGNFKDLQKLSFYMELRNWKINCSFSF